MEGPSSSGSGRGSGPISMKKQILSFKRLIVPGGMRSIYWKYFGFPGDDQNTIITREKIICSICKVQMAYNGNTSNLRMHLQNKHAAYLMNLEATAAPYVPKSRGNKRKSNFETGSVVHTVSLDGGVERIDVASLARSTSPAPSGPIKFISIGTDDTDNDSPTIEYVTTAGDSLDDSVTYYFPEGDDSARLDDAELGETLVKFLASEVLPPVILESNGFIKLISKINPSVSLPSCKQMEEDIIPRHYEDMRSEILTEFESVEHVSLTLEEWTGVDDARFLTITAHFLHEAELLSRNIMTVQWSGEEREVISKTLEHWGIEKDRVIAAVVASSDEDLLQELEEWTMPLPCFLFCLQEAVLACFNLPEVSVLIDKCRAIVSSFKQKENFSPDSKGVASFAINMDYPKIWTSTYEMMEEIVNTKSEISTLLVSSERKLTAEEWADLATICEVLSPFKVTVQTLQEENPALLSLVKPLLSQLLTNYLEVKDEDNELNSSIKTLLKSKLSIAYQSLERDVLLQSATTLDPRFKQMSCGPEDDSEHIKQVIKCKLAKVITKNDSNTSTSSPASSSSPPAKKKLTGMALLLGDLCSSKPEMRPEERSDLEFSQYMSESPVAFDESPLLWWSNSKCCNLAVLAKRYLCIPACASISCRMPPKQKAMFERHRATLPLELVNKMMFLNGNIATNIQ